MFIVCCDLGCSTGEDHSSPAHMQSNEHSPLWKNRWLVGKKVTQKAQSCSCIFSRVLLSRSLHVSPSLLQCYMLDITQTIKESLTHKLNESHYLLTLGSLQTCMLSFDFNGSLFSLPMHQIMHFVCLPDVFFNAFSEKPLASRLHWRASIFLLTQTQFLNISR